MKASVVTEILCICAVGGFLFLAGCGGQRECAPQIVGEVVFPTYTPATPAPKPAEDANTTANKLGIPVEWLPPKEKEHSWFAIIIHHSATDKGNAAYFDKEHKGRVDDSGDAWVGIGYDFVIGNGTLSGDGEVEPTFRWQRQIVGAHCKTADNWANTYGIGIVLVGNFDNSLPSGEQMAALVKLVSYLQKRYDVPTNDIYGHGETPGAHATDCPGSRFPMYALKRQLSEQIVASHNAATEELHN